MTWTRRDLLRAAGVLSAAAALPHVVACQGPGPDYVYTGPPSPIDRFAHAVASGDPLVDSVILWTCVQLDAGEDAIEAYVEVSESADFARRVAATYVEATADRGGCVKVDLSGLRPGRAYYYRFRVQDQTSPIGRTRTAPRRDTDRLRLALVSCSNYGSGWFHGYRALAARDDLDLVLHAGDYIYEGGGGIEGRRVEPPREILSLDDYRVRYGHYRRDPDLQAVHRQHPVVATWDDHESANNAWATGADAHNPDTEGPWDDRLAAARQAWFEWLPAREGTEGVLYRRVGWGDLVDLFVLDSRIAGREEQATAGDVVADPDRQLLGSTQERWLLDGLTTSTARWKVLLQQVVFAPWVRDGARPPNPDQWDGYPAARARILDRIAADGIDGVVILTGDIHSSWVFDVPRDIDAYDPRTGSGSVAVEAVTPAVTSSGADLGDIAGALGSLLPHLHYVETLLRGFVILDLDLDRALAQWWHFADGETVRPDPVEPTLAVSFRCDHGVPHWVPTDEAMPDRERAPAAP